MERVPETNMRKISCPKCKNVHDVDMNMVSIETMHGKPYSYDCPDCGTKLKLERSRKPVTKRDRPKRVSKKERLRMRKAAKEAIIKKGQNVGMSTTVKSS